MQVSRIGRVLAKLAAIVSVTVLAGCGSEPTGSETQEWEVVRSGGANITEDSLANIMLSAGCTNPVAARETIRVQLPGLQSGFVWYGCGALSRDSIVHVVSLYFEARRATVAGEHMMTGYYETVWAWKEYCSIDGLTGDVIRCGIWFAFPYQVWVAPTDEGYNSGGGGGGSGGGGGVPATTTGADTVVAVDSLPPTVVVEVFDEPDADSLPVCRNAHGVEQFQSTVAKSSWCVNPAASGTQVTKIQQSIDKMRTYGGACTALADLLQTALVHGNIHVGQLTDQFGAVRTGMGVSGSRSAEDGPDQVYITIHPEMFNHDSKSKRLELQASNGDKTMTTLTSILAHETDHSLYGFDSHVPGNVLRTPNSQECSELGLP